MSEVMMMDTWTLGAMAAAGAAGAVTWGILEYVLHRFVGHQPRSMTEFAREHRMHHALGNYFAPTARKVVAVTPVLLIVGVAGWFASGVIGIGYVAGLATTYLGYEWFHRRLHTHAPTGPWGRWARRHHFHHHYGDPRTNHGVTSPVMDFLVGTREVPGVIRIPVKLVPAWLLDGEGRVRQEFAAEYALAGAGRLVSTEGDAHGAEERALAAVSGPAGR